MFIIDIKHNVKAMNGFFFFQKALWDRFITSLKNGLQQVNQGEVCQNIMINVLSNFVSLINNRYEKLFLNHLTLSIFD